MLGRAFAASFAALLVALAPVARGANLPDYTSHAAAGSRVTFRCGVPAVVVEFVDPRVCRISLYPDGVVSDDSSVAVLPHPGASVPISVEDGGDTITVRSAAISVLCPKRPFRIHLRDAAGRALLDEPQAAGLGWEGAQRSFRFALGADHLYGLGERAAPFDRRGLALDTYNRAVYGYGPDTPTMNLNIPFVTSSRGWGLLFDNPWPGVFDLAYSEPGVLAGSAQSGPMRLYFIAGPDLKGVLERYTWLTGRPPLPPRWALGYLQSKFGYHSRHEAEAIANGFRTSRIPLDALILDLYWYGRTSDMGRFDWDASNWPDPRGMIEGLLQGGVHTVLIEEPYLVTSTANYAAAAAGGFLGKDRSGEPYLFGMWAGTAGLIDFTSPAASDWWWQLHRPLLAQGVAGWWLDLGEPETHPDDMVHAGGPARAVHNVYNLEWLQALYDRQRADRPGQRVFLLTRSGYAGMQRTGAVSWSGDVQKSFEDLAAQVPMLLGMGLSGVGWHNSDIGGYTSGTTTPELYARWMEFGAFCPLARAHGVGQPTEPWAFDIPVQEISRRYLQLRQRLIPYSYTLAREYSQTGTPMARPLVLEYPDDARVATLSDEYLWGRAFLVAPVTAEGATTRAVYLPAGRWTNYWTGELLEGPVTAGVAAPLERMPLFVRDGSLVPMQNVMPSSGAFPLDTLTLDVFPADTASFTLYEDDGGSYGYETGAFATTALCFGAAGTSARLHVGGAEGAYSGQPANRTWLAQVRRVTSPPASVRLSGAPLAARADSLALGAGESGWWYDAAGARLLVKWRSPAAQAVEVVLDSLRIAGVLEWAGGAGAPALRAWPNPVRDATTLRFALPAGSAEAPRLEVFDLRGRRVADLSSAVRLDGGSGSADFHTLGLAQGVYFVRLRAGGAEPRLSLTVVR